MRRIQTDRAPGQAERNPWPLWWDFRRTPDGWILEIPFIDAGGSQARPVRPEQAAWLATLGAIPDRLGRIPLSEALLGSITGALEGVVGPSWEAHEAMDATVACQAAGDVAGALAASERLADAAPTWVLGRRKRLEILIHGIRDPDLAAAELDRLGGVLEPDEIRRERQTVALLRDDWVTYANMQAEMISDGLREAWAWEVLGLAWWAAGDLDRAMAALEAGLTEHPGHRELALREAEVLAARGQQDEALARLEALAAQGPPHAKTLALRGWHRRHRDAAAAAADYEAAIALEADQPVARVGRGLQRLEAGDREGARADLKPFKHCGWTEAAEAWRLFKAGEP